MARRRKQRRQQPVEIKSDTASVNADVASGFRIIETKTTEKMIDGSTRTIDRGYIVEYFDGSQTRYYGSTMTEHVRAGQVFSPYKSREDAQAGAARMYEKWKSVERVRTRKVRTAEVVFGLMCAQLDEYNTPKRPSQIHLSLNMEETCKLASVRIAARHLNSEIGGRRPVVSQSDAIRYLLQQVPAQDLIDWIAREEIEEGKAREEEASEIHS